MIVTTMITLVKLDANFFQYFSRTITKVISLRNITVRAVSVVFDYRFLPKVNTSFDMWSTLTERVNHGYSDFTVNMYSGESLVQRIQMYVGDYSCTAFHCINVLTECILG